MVQKHRISTNIGKDQKVTVELNQDYDFIFANGGDQNNNSIPEVLICMELGIELLDGLGEKIQSSSWLLK